MCYVRSKADVKVHCEILKDRMKPKNISKKAHSRINNSWRKKPGTLFVESLKKNMERFVDKFATEGFGGRGAEGVEIANSEDVREGRIPMRFGTRDYLDRLRSNSAGRFEDQKVLSREKDLSLIYVKRALGMINPQLLSELSQFNDVTDREMKLCYTVADLIALVNSNSRADLDSWEAFQSYAQRE